MMASNVSTSDVVLVLSLVYLAFDILSEWEDFSGCPSPIHLWLVVSYALLAASRVVVGIGSMMQTDENGSFLTNSRQKGRSLQVLYFFTWLGLVPFFIFWSGLGSVWTWRVLREDPGCMPSQMHLAFLLLWQVMSYAWIVVYSGLGAMACIMERRLRRAEAELRDLEDPDVVRRWGHVGQLEGYSALPAKMKGGGMTPAQIKALGGESKCSDDDFLGEDCPICLNSICAGDNIRTLGNCKHAFHRSCVDLWLLRSVECPLCKCRVQAGDDELSEARVPAPAIPEG